MADELKSDKEIKMKIGPPGQTWGQSSGKGYGFGPGYIAEVTGTDLELEPETDSLPSVATGGEVRTSYLEVHMTDAQVRRLRVPLDFDIDPGDGRLD